MSKRLLVTGGTGLIGRALVQPLQNKTGKFILFIDDLLELVRSSIEKQIISYELITTGFDYGLSINELVDIVAKIEGVTIQKNFLLDKLSLKFSFVCDIFLAFQKFGWKSTTRLEEAIAKTLDWWTTNIDPHTLKERHSF